MGWPTVAAAGWAEVGRLSRRSRRAREARPPGPGRPVRPPAVRPCPGARPVPFVDRHLGDLERRAVRPDDTCPFTAYSARGAQRNSPSAWSYTHASICSATSRADRRRAAPSSRRTARRTLHPPARRGTPRPARRTPGAPRQAAPRWTGRITRTAARPTRAAASSRSARVSPRASWPRGRPARRRGGRARTGDPQRRGAPRPGTALGWRSAAAARAATRPSRVAHGPAQVRAGTAWRRPGRRCTTWCAVTTRRSGTARPGAVAARASSTHPLDSASAYPIRPSWSMRIGSSILFQVMQSQFSGDGSTMRTVPTGPGALATACSGWLLVRVTGASLPQGIGPRQPRGAGGTRVVAG